MKRISNVTGKTQPTRMPSNRRYSTGSHCPITGIWEDRVGTLRLIAGGAIFPSTDSGPTVWTLRTDQILQD